MSFKILLCLILACSIAHSSSLPNQSCPQGYFKMWNDTCSESCLAPLIQETQDGASFCSYPCNTDEHLYLYANGTCSDSCIYTPVNESGYLFCRIPCQDYLYQNKTCKATCLPPFVQGDSIDGRTCTFPCPAGQYYSAFDDACIQDSETELTRVEDGILYRELSNFIDCVLFHNDDNTTTTNCTEPTGTCPPGYFLFEDFTCNETCPDKFIAYINATCSSPCGLYDALYPDGSCSSNCSANFTTRMEGNFTFCDQNNSTDCVLFYHDDNTTATNCTEPTGTCPPGYFLFEDFTCNETCPDKFIAYINATCSSPCGLYDALYPDGSCSSNCTANFTTRMEGNFTFCDQNNSTDCVLTYNDDNTTTTNCTEPTGTCPPGYFLFEDFTCNETCPDKFIAYINATCSSPCGLYDALYPDGSCSSNCTANFTTRMEGNFTFCDQNNSTYCFITTNIDKSTRTNCTDPTQTCPPAYFLFEDSTCKKNCPAQFTPYLNATCISPCGLINNAVYPDGGCSANCTGNFTTRVDGNFSFCEPILNGTYTAVLAIYIRYDIKVEDFYSQDGIAKFLQLLASLFGVDISQITILDVREGSTIIESEVAVNSESDSESKAATDEKIKTMSQQFENAENLEIEGMKVLNRHSSIVIPGDNIQAEESSSSAVMIGAAVGAALAVSAVGATIYSVRRRKQMLIGDSYGVEANKNTERNNNQSREEFAGLKHNTTTIQTKENNLEDIQERNRPSEVNQPQEPLEKKLRR